MYWMTGPQATGPLYRSIEFRWICVYVPAILRHAYLLFCELTNGCNELLEKNHPAIQYDHSTTSHTKKKYHIIPSEKTTSQDDIPSIPRCGIWPCFQEKVHSNKRETWNPFHLQFPITTLTHLGPLNFSSCHLGTLGTDGNRKFVPRRGGTAAEHRWQHLHFRWMCRLVQKCRGWSVNEGEWRMVRCC